MKQTASATKAPLPPSRSHIGMSIRYYSAGWHDIWGTDVPGMRGGHGRGSVCRLAYRSWAVGPTSAQFAAPGAGLGRSGRSDRPSSGGECCDPNGMRGCHRLSAVSYTHLRAHETDSYLVC